MENNKDYVNIEKIYPIGSIYFQAPEFLMKPPQEIFGGVWEPTGRCYLWNIKTVVWKRVK